MFLSDISVKRPVFAAVINLIIIAFGIISFSKLPLREFPDIDPPIVSIQTFYQGAAASVVESRITQIIEDRIAGIEGIKTINSQSIDGTSRVTVEFDISRDIDNAANDIRDRVASITGDLPDEADPPEIQKADADSDVILWLNLDGEGMSIMDITDYAERYVQDRFSALDGVASVRIGGGQERSMRIWLNKDAMAARNLTVDDIENALRTENVELPAGSIESVARDFTVRVRRSYQTEQDFANLVLFQGKDGYLVRLGDVARVSIEAVEKRSALRGNGLPMVGVGIIKQSKANTLDVARIVKAEAEEVNKSLPKNMKLGLSYDSSVFIDHAVHEVYLTLFITIILVILVIYSFLGNWRATLIPATAVPVSIISAFIVIFAMGFTINLFTLLALILAIGLVVDDAIVVIENIHRRIEMGEPPLVAAYRGTNQVAFAVVATTIVLIAVFLPIVFLEGNVGRLFSEFAITIAAAVAFSGFTALSLSPMLASIFLTDHDKAGGLTKKLDAVFDKIRVRYMNTLKNIIGRPLLVTAILLGMFLAIIVLFKFLPKEFTPQEDRGVFFLMIHGPEGSSYDYTMEHVDEIEKRLQKFVDDGSIRRLLMRVPGSFGNTASFSDARGIVVLSDWEDRKPMDYYMGEARKLSADLTGVKTAAISRQGFSGAQGKPVQFVIGGPTYAELAKWRDIILAKAAENKNLVNVDSDYFETKPQLGIIVDRDRAGTLGVPVSSINRTLETLLGSRRITTFMDRGEEYDIILESEKSLKSSTLDISNIYVRSTRTQELIPLSNLVTIEEFADATSLNRYNRVRAITIDANLAPGYSQGEALDYLENLVRTELPAGVTIDYKGQSLEFRDSSGSVYTIFILAMVIVFLVLAGQFESWIHPLVIMLTVPLAIAGALFALWITGQSLNIYSQIGLIMLVGIAAKNGILIVEFTNQLRDEGVAFLDAIMDAASKRLRPVVMTSVTTIIGAVPLLLTGGAGSETRTVIGIVIIGGLAITTFFTVFAVPVMYNLLAKRTESPFATTKKLEALLQKHKDVI